MGQDEPHRETALFDAAAKNTYDSNPDLWGEVLTVLNLDLCYQPTIADVLQRGTWRTAANPRAYIATAAVRSARGKKLPDYFEKEFRRVPSDEPNSDVGTRLDSGAEFDLENWGGGGVYERTASGAIRYVDDSDDYGLERRIPAWLRRGHETDTVDWETVAAYAVLKPRMACQLARVLITRLELRIGRPEAMARAANTDESAAIEATWKWIDRNVQDRIAPLFKGNRPPRSLTEADIASFPLLSPGVSLRVDLQPHWDGKRLFLVRATFVQDVDEIIPLCYVEADSEAEAMDTYRLAATERHEELSSLFHFWDIEKTAPAENSEPSTEGGFVKPWVALSRAQNKPFRPR